jgi:hypothetical protein
MMTKRDFEALAAAFKRTEPLFSDTPEYRAWRACLSAVSDVCAASNDRFDRLRFQSAASNGPKPLI